MNHSPALFSQPKRTIPAAAVYNLASVHTRCEKPTRPRPAISPNYPHMHIAYYDN